MVENTDNLLVARLVRPVELADVIVPLDGSDRAMAAVPVARQLARRLGATLTLVAVVRPGEDRGELQHQVGQVAAEADGQAMLLDGDDVATAILAVARQLPRHVVCMASHGRGRSAGLLGSVAAELAARAPDPVVLVGPNVPRDHSVPATWWLASTDRSDRSRYCPQPRHGRRRSGSPSRS